jgi:hypothetical protein
MVGKKEFTLTMCGFALFIMFFVYVIEPSITGQQFRDDTMVYGIKDGKATSGSVQSMNLFIPKRGFIRHTECFADEFGVGYCERVWGPGENGCWFDYAWDKYDGYGYCNHLECKDGRCVRVAGATEELSSCKKEGNFCLDRFK